MKKLLFVLSIFYLLNGCNKPTESKDSTISQQSTQTQQVEIDIEQKIKNKFTQTKQSSSTQTIQQSAILTDEDRIKDEEAAQKSDHKKKDASSQIELGKQLLEMLARFPNLNETERLLKEGADVNAPHLYADYPTSPLYLAIDTGDIKLIKLLIDNGADVNFEDYDCGEADCYGNPSSPLIKAVKLGNKEIIKLLLNNKANINMEVHSGDDLGMTALRAAVEKNDKEIIDLLLKNGANDIFIALARPDLLSTLLANGADINSKDIYEGTIVSIAKKQGKEKLVQLFLDNGAKDSEATNPVVESDGYFHAYNNIDKQLAVAQQTDDTALAEKLIKYGAVSGYEEGEKESIIIPTPTKEENIIWAAKNGFIEIVKELLAQDADINTNIDGEVLLISAVDSGNVEMVKLLLDKGADPNIKGYFSYPATGLYVEWTALSQARKQGKTEIVELLKAAGAKE